KNKKDAEDKAKNPNLTYEEAKNLQANINKANEKIEEMQKVGLLVDMVNGALYNPSDTLAGTAVNTLSPAVVYKVGQYFKENEKLNKLDGGDRDEQGSTKHLLAQALVAGVTARLAGNDILSSSISGGGGEAIAPYLAEYIYGVNPKDVSKMTAEQKQTISAIISLGSMAVGATSGSVTDMVASGEAGRVAVEENRIILKGTANQKTILLDNLQMLTDDELTVDKKGKVNIVNKIEGEHPIGTKLVNELISSDKTVSVSLNQNEDSKAVSPLSAFPGVHKGVGSDSRVNLNTNAETTALETKADGTKVIAPIPSYIILGHELDHALDLANGTFGYETDKVEVRVKNGERTFRDNSPTREYGTVGIHGYDSKNGTSENAIRKEHNLNERASYVTPSD
ncbi:MAG: hypothetical protein FNT15_09985, partial [Sulfurovum sp.]